MILRTIFATLLVLSTVTAVADELKLANGRTISGTVVSVNDTEVVVKLDAGARLTLKLTQLKPESVYYIRRQRLKRDDAPGHVKLGDWCLQQSMWFQSRSLYRRAAKIDAAIAADIARRLTAVDAREGEHMYRAAVNAMTAGDHKAALAWAKKVIARFPTSSWGAKARTLSGQALAKLSAPVVLKPAPVKGGAKKPPVKMGGGKKPPVKPVKAGKLADPATLRGRLRKMYTYIAKVEKAGDAQTAEALRHDGKGSVAGARRNYEAAVASYESGLKVIGTVHKYSRQAAEAAALFKSMGDRLVKKIINDLINATTVMVREGNYRRAALYCDHALRYDAANRHALKLRQEIADNRITRKASELTNIGGTTNNNGSGGVGGIGK